MSSAPSADDAYGPDEPPELDLDLAKLMDRASSALGTLCTDARRLTRGTWHEIFTLQFEETNANTFPSLARAGFSCIARFSRVRGRHEREESEVITIRHLKDHTDLPVPEIYYQDLNPDNDVGAAYVLMEKLPGRHLGSIWDGLSREHKKAVLTEIASVVAQLASLKFDRIGSLHPYGLGPVFNAAWDTPRGPFTTTTSFLQSFVSPHTVESTELVDLFTQIQVELITFLMQEYASYLAPPFVMIHPNLNGQNLLFSQPDSPDPAGSEAPTLTGLIDLQHAHTGPRYFLYQHPAFLKDTPLSSNRALRAHFVREIYRLLPEDDPEERTALVKAMNGRCYALDGIQETFARPIGPAGVSYASEELLAGWARVYLGRVEDGPEEDYMPERYSETGDLILNGHGIHGINVSGET